MSSLTEGGSFPTILQYPDALLANPRKAPTLRAHFLIRLTCE